MLFPSFEIFGNELFLCKIYFCSIINCAIHTQLAEPHFFQKGKLHKFLRTQQNDILEDISLALFQLGPSIAWRAFYYSFPNFWNSARRVWVKYGSNFAIFCAE
jgi:hypothetical protein